MASGIYIIRFKGSTRVYIGQSVDLKRRFKHHIFCLKNGIHKNQKLQRACNKYGFENLLIEILEEASVPFLNEREQHYIKLYNSYRNGFNFSQGGDHERSRILKSSKKIYKYSAKDGMLLGCYIGFVNTERHCSINESNIRQCCAGKLKTVKGFHFSTVLKTPQMVLSDTMHDFYKKEYKSKRSKQFSGKLNPMFGKKRPEISGANNPYSKMIASGYKPKRKIKITVEELIQLYKSGLTQKSIAAKAECTQVQVSTILRENNIFKFKRKAA